MNFHLPQLHFHLGLVPAENRNVKRLPSSLAALVPAPTDDNITVKPQVPDTEKDTMPLIINKAKRTAWQTKKLAAKLIGATLSETLQNDSRFILDYIKYKKDDPMNEQIRSPRRLIHDRAGDCDCFSVFLATLLINQGINFKFRISRYQAGDWAHIYVIVPNDQTTLSVANRTDYTVLDPVTNKHNYEVAYQAKKDYDMNGNGLGGLQFMDGLPSEKGLACCAPSGNSPAKPKKIYVVSNRWLQDSGITSTATLLDRLGLSYVQKTTPDGKPSYEVTTPTGDKKTVPGFISINPDDQDQLTNDLLAPVAQAATDATTAVQTLTPDQKKKALWWLLGIGAGLVLFNSGLSKPSVQGLGALKGKKIPIVRI